MQKLVKHVRANFSEGILNICTVKVITECKHQFIATESFLDYHYSFLDGPLCNSLSDLQYHRSLLKFKHFISLTNVQGHNTCPT